MRVRPSDRFAASEGRHGRTAQSDAVASDRQRGSAPLRFLPFTTQRLRPSASDTEKCRIPSVCILGKEWHSEKTTGGNSLGQRYLASHRHGAVVFWEICSAVDC